MKVLSFGLEPYPVEGYEVVHCPLIEVVPLPFQAAWELFLQETTHLLFTSKTAVDLFPFFPKKVLAIGKGTAKRAQEKGYEVSGVAAIETQEGMTELLTSLNEVKLFWPRSDLARPILSNFCKDHQIFLNEAPIYTIKKREVELPALDQFQALFFSSPSTVDAFLSLKISVPQGLQLLTMGEVTCARLKELF